MAVLTRAATCPGQARVTEGEGRHPFGNARGRVGRPTRGRFDLKRAAVCACALSIAAAPAPAAPSHARPTSTGPRSQDPQVFDIPGQPLASALERYAVISDQTVLFSDDLVAQRRSSAVEGRYTAREALDLLLSGTSLRAERVGLGARASFVLRPVVDEPSPPPNGHVAVTLDRRHDGLLQRRIWRTLCASALTAPGAYRAVLRLDLDAQGRWTRPRLLSGTGEPRRDAAIVAALQGLPVEAPLPAGQDPTMTLLLLPTAESRAHCRAEDPSP